MAPFELDRREPIGVSVTPHGVVEHLNALEYVAPSGIAITVDLSPNALALEQLERTLGHRVVMAVPAPAHARHQSVSLQEGLPVMAAVKRSCQPLVDNCQPARPQMPGAHSGILTERTAQKKSRVYSYQAYAELPCR